MIYHYTYIILDCQNTGNIKRWSGCGTGTFHWGMQNCTATLEESLVVSYETKHAFTKLSSNQVP